MNDTQLILDAAHFAACKHANQRRKNAAGTPYINHPIGVARRLQKTGGVTSPVVLAAALLHDVVEDTGTRIDEIEHVFGAEVANVVAEVTDDKSLPKAERKRLQVQNAPHKSRQAKLVKLADKLDNLSDLQIDPPQGWTLGTIWGYFVWAHAVCAGLRGTNEELERALDKVFAGVFRFQGIDHPVLPDTADVREAMLLEYYKNM